MGNGLEKYMRPDGSFDREAAFEDSKRKNEAVRVEITRLLSLTTPQYLNDEEIAKIIDNPDLLQRAFDLQLIDDERLERYIAEHPSTHEE